jgi:hypothetical protein
MIFAAGEVSHLEALSGSGHVERFGRGKREEIDRTLDLTMDLTVPEFFVLGFQPGIPWSLYATASLPVSQDYPSHILSVDVFRRLPFSELAGVLATRLEEGLTSLRKINREDILSKGQIHGEGGRAT